MVIKPVQHVAQRHLPAWIPARGQRAMPRSAGIHGYGTDASNTGIQKHP